MSIGDHPGSPCQDVCNHFPWWLCETQFYAEAQSMNFRGYVILQIFDFLQLIPYKLKIFLLEFIRKYAPCVQGVIF